MVGIMAMQYYLAKLGHKSRLTFSPFFLDSDKIVNATKIDNQMNE
jgi:hypothetical protein